jgi:hypothetical protein
MTSTLVLDARLLRVLVATTATDLILLQGCASRP